LRKISAELDSKGGGGGVEGGVVVGSHQYDCLTKTSSWRRDRRRAEADSKKLQKWTKEIGAVENLAHIRMLHTENEKKALKSGGGGREACILENKY